jgi:hypothetical protein
LKVRRKQWFSIDFLEKHESELPELPRKSGAARHRAFEFETAEERFKSIYFAIIDSMVKEIKSRVQKCRNRRIKMYY